MNGKILSTAMTAYGNESTVKSGGNNRKEKWGLQVLCA